MGSSSPVKTRLSENRVPQESHGFLLTNMEWAVGGYSDFRHQKMYEQQAESLLAASSNFQLHNLHASNNLPSRVEPDYDVFPTWNQRLAACGLRLACITGIQETVVAAHALKPCGIA